MFLTKFDKMLSEFHEKIIFLEVLMKIARGFRKMLEISGIQFDERFHFYFNERPPRDASALYFLQLHFFSPTLKERSKDRLWPYGQMPPSQTARLCKSIPSTAQPAAHCNDSAPHPRVRIGATPPVLLPEAVALPSSQLVEKPRIFLVL